MDVAEELTLFKRYSTVYGEDDSAALTISSIHLAQQLEKYMSPSLDLGWIIKCVLDSTSQNLFSNSRGEADETSAAIEIAKVQLQVQPEYQHARLIMRMCTMLTYLVQDKSLEEELVPQFELNESSRFFYGEQLADLNDALLRLVTAKEV